MLAKFRRRYPQGSLVSELVKIDRGTYIVKAIVQIDGIVLATALAGADTVENAEDAAQERAIANLFLDSPLSTNNSNSKTPSKADDSQLVSQTKAQPLDEPLVQQKFPNEPKIVNFSKPHSEISSQELVPPETTHTPVTVSHNSISTTDTMTDKSSEETSRTQPKLEVEQIDNPVQSAPISSNLFGDTYAAEIPEEVSLSDKDVVSIVPEVDSVTTPTSEMEAMDFNEIKQKTDIEIKRLSWTKDQGKDFLMSHYGKRSRLHLTDEQLLEFLRYLEQLPSPTP